MYRHFNFFISIALGMLLLIPLTGYSQQSTSDVPSVQDSMTKSEYIQKVKSFFRKYKSEEAEQEQSGAYKQAGEKKDYGWRKYFKRWKHYMAPRMGQVGSPYVQGNFQNPWVQKQLNDSRAKKPNKICDAGGAKPDWELLGPTRKYSKSQGRQARGRMVSVAVHPNDTNTIYAGSSHSGLYKTADHGRTWKNVTDSKRIPGLGIQDIAINPKNPQELYITTGHMAFAYSTSNLLTLTHKHTSTLTHNYILKIPPKS